MLWPAFLLKGVHGAWRAGPGSGAAEGVVVVVVVVVPGCLSGWERDWAGELAMRESREGDGGGGTSVVGGRACMSPEAQSWSRL